MQNNTGMIRKLDEVGRIVIPKEIRHYLGLKEGTNLEIGINELGDVVLKNTKLSKISEEIISLLGNNLCNILDRTIIFVSNGNVYRSFVDKISGELSASILKIIEDGNTYFASTKDKTTLIPIFIDITLEYHSIAVVPCILLDSKGCIIAISNKDYIDIHEVKLLELVAKLMEGVLR